MLEVGDSQIAEEASPTHKGQLSEGEVLFNGDFGLKLYGHHVFNTSGDDAEPANVFKYFRGFGRVFTFLKRYLRL